MECSERWKARPWAVLGVSLLILSGPAHALSPACKAHLESVGRAMKPFEPGNVSTSVLLRHLVWVSQEVTVAAKTACDPGISEDAQFLKLNQDALADAIKMCRSLARDCEPVAPAGYRRPERAQAKPEKTADDPPAIGRTFK